MSNDWEETLEHAIASFSGQAPTATLEAFLRQQHEQHPQTVRAAINRIADQHAAGTIRSPWGVLKSELEKRRDTAPQVKAGNDQAKALTRAEQRMRAEFLHYDRWTEIADELFREGAPLHPWPHLEQQLHNLWDELRPAGILVEEQAIARQAAYANPQPRKHAA